MASLAISNVINGKKSKVKLLMAGNLENTIGGKFKTELLMARKTEIKLLMVGRALKRLFRAGKWNKALKEKAGKCF